MPMSLVDLLICVFAAAGLVDLWLKDRRLDRVRYWIEFRKIPGISDLVGCRFCLTYWAAIVTVLAAQYAAMQLKAGGVVYILLCVFAAAAAANRLAGEE